ncbi:MAG TPA: RluA family pseudouridine synthase [Pirellulaceae bacterium]|nr:RluA family pseudouridine synthase [Pirellulaceae bacterium]
MSPSFSILHEDSACLVVSKPAGLLTQAPLGIDSLEVQVKRYLAEHGGQQGDVYLGVPHRIDRPVSGVLVLAKDRKAARRISQQFERRQVEKTYWALVEGNVQPDEGTWTDHLKKVYGKPRSQVVEASDPLGQIAILHYKVLESTSAIKPEAQAKETADLPMDRFPSLTLQACGPLAERADYVSLLEIRLETGRTHQIRIQCASRGHILLGDELYGSQRPFGPPSDDERMRFIALHARSLKFRHPVTKETVTALAPLPEYWKEAGVSGY